MCMSMRDYAVDDYGMVLNTNHLQMLAKRICEDYSDKEWEKSADSRYDFLDEVSEKSDMQYISGFDGEAILIADDGSDDWNDSLPYDDDSIYYIPLSSYPTMFKPAYNSVDEIVDELREKVGRFLPQGFEYRNNIRHIVGTYYG